MIIPAPVVIRLPLVSAIPNPSPSALRTMAWWGRIARGHATSSPIIINSAFFPNLMWNSRFAALSNDPFDNRAGFLFPAPEGLSLSHLSHLLTAQAFIPPTERVEVAGFDFPCDSFAIRGEVLNRLNAIPEYRRLFGRVFSEVRRSADHL